MFEYFRNPAVLRRISDNLFLLISLVFIFWPWGLAVVSALYWFFNLHEFFLWTSERMLFALLWPFGALPVWVFLLTLFEHFGVRSK